MAIRYSLLPRNSNLSEKDAPWQVYAAAQSTEVVTLQKIARHLSSHNSVFSEGTIIGLLTDFQKCIVEQLKNGARVDLGELGAFYTTLRGKGAPSSEEFTTDLVEHIQVRWRVSKEMDKAMQHTKLVQVATRAKMRQAKKEMIQKTNEEIEASMHHASAATSVCP